MNSNTYGSTSNFKAITLWNPWAAFIPTLFKHYETRSWKTDYRGTLLIHAAQRPVQELELLYIRRNLSVCPIELSSLQYHPGCIVAVCQLVDCIYMSKDFIAQQTELELAVGLWQPGRYAWKLNAIRPLEQPIPIKGKLGLWNVTQEIQQKVAAVENSSLKDNFDKVLFNGSTLAVDTV